MCYSRLPQEIRGETLAEDFPDIPNFNLPTFLEDEGPVDSDPFIINFRALQRETGWGLTDFGLLRDVELENYLEPLVRYLAGGDDGNLTESGWTPQPPTTDFFTAEGLDSTIGSSLQNNPSEDGDEVAAVSLDSLRVAVDQLLEDEDYFEDFSNSDDWLFYDSEASVMEMEFYDRLEDVQAISSSSLSSGSDHEEVIQISGEAKTIESFVGNSENVIEEDKVEDIQDDALSKAIDSLRLHGERIEEAIDTQKRLQESIKDALDSLKQLTEVTQNAINLFESQILNEKEEEEDKE